MKAFLIDLSICNGCYACQVACKDEHVANDWSPIAKPQPDVGQFWLKIDEQVRGTIPKVKVSYRPHMCMHCGKCIEFCSENAIYRRDDGLVIIDPEKCTGCQKCVSLCPYGAISFNRDLNIAQKCTGCAHLLDDGWSVPRCVDSCPTEALKFGEESELADLIAKAETWKPETGVQPRVHYLNIMKRFVAGTVYDPVEKEVVIGAELTLTGDDGKTFTLKTDNFGDFWFEDLSDNANYTLKIEYGDKKKTIEGIRTEKDVNLGDIPL